MQDIGFPVTLEDIAAFAEEFGRTHKAATTERYRKALLTFYEALPEDKQVCENTLTAWVQSLAGVYSPSHINLLVSACNAFMRHTGHEAYQAGYWEPQARSQMELTREEYLHLLATARAMHKEKVYLCMRLIAAAGMEVSDLQALTVEAVNAGKVMASGRIVRLPDGLREELLDYALHTGVRGGPIFVGRAGGTLNPTALRQSIKAVSKAAGFGDGKACARTLRKLYETTRAEITAQTVERLMLEQADEEQREHGWES